MSTGEEGTLPRLQKASNGTDGGPPPTHLHNDVSHFVNNVSYHVTGGGDAGNGSSVVINNVTLFTSPTVPPSTDDGSGVPGGVIALVLCLLLVGIIVFAVVFYLKRTGRLYNMIPFKRLATGPRRSSFSCSDRALHMKDTVHDEEEFHDEYRDGDLGNPPTSRIYTAPSTAVAAGRRHNNNKDEKGGGEGERDAATTMFTIEDRDMDSVDIGDGTSRGTNDEYFYDEVFGTSMFEDEVTNASMRELVLASDHAEDEEGVDELDVDAFVESIVSPSKIKPGSTSAPAAAKKT